MRSGIYENWRILTAALVSVVLVVGAFVIARGSAGPGVAQASDESQILQAIATKDSDGDGLPDWQEALYGTDPQVADTFRLGMTDGEAVARGLIVPKAIADVRSATSSPLSVASIDGSLPTPPAEGTLTATFAQNFFTLYIAAKQKNGGADLSDTQLQDIVAQSVAALESSLAPAPDFKRSTDLFVSGSGPDALRAFAEKAERISDKDAVYATTSEIAYFKYALVGHDATAYRYMQSIAKGYEAFAKDLAAVPVPQELAATDLELINSLMRLSRIITDLTRADSDTLMAIIALQQYPAEVLTLAQAFADIGNIYRASGVVLPDGTPGAAFINVTKNVQAAQAVAGTP